MPGDRGRRQDIDPFRDVRFIFATAQGCFRSDQEDRLDVMRKDAEIGLSQVQMDMIGARSRRMDRLPAQFLELAGQSRGDETGRSNDEGAPAHRIIIRNR